jgi:hypothetical protein
VLDSADVPDGACTPPSTDDYLSLCRDVVYTSEAGPSSPTWDSTANKLTFHLTFGAWTVVSATATAMLTGADGGTRMINPAAVVRGSDVVIDLTSVLADPSVEVVTINQLELDDACTHAIFVSGGGSGGAFFYVTIQRTPPVFSNPGCQSQA